MDIVFFITSISLGIGLAMDAFSVSLATGLNEKGMKAPRMCAIAGTFGIFQAIMPLTGWVCIHTIIEKFQSLQKFIPWIALLLLLYIGGKMLIEGIKAKKEDKKDAVEGKMSFATLMLMGVATSIDALSVGFDIADYDFFKALVASIIIAIVTFIICIGGILIGRKFGTKFADKANIFGGIILIAIGIEIFLTGIL